jgi:transposase
LKAKQCPIKQEIKQEALAELFELESKDLIELYFGDESGFCNVPVVARAWQFRDEEIRITPQRSKRLNVFGFLRQSNEAKTWITEKAVTAQFVVDAIEESVQEKLAKPRVLILDNARIHRSRLVQSKVAQWEAKNLYVFFLPAYSPHLNLIETLWRKMKYEWLKAQDYVSFEKLVEAVKEILGEIGKKYRIKFRDRTSTK